MLRAHGGGYNATSGGQNLRFFGGSWSGASAWASANLVRMTDWRSWPRREVDGGPLTQEQLPQSLRRGAGVRANYDYLQEWAGGMKRPECCAEKRRRRGRTGGEEIFSSAKILADASMAIAVNEQGLWYPCFASIAFNDAGKCADLIRVGTVPKMLDPIDHSRILRMPPPLKSCADPHTCKPTS